MHWTDLSSKHKITYRQHSHLAFCSSHLARPGKKAKRVVAKHIITAGGLHADTVAKTAGGSSNPAVLTFRGTYYQMKPEYRKADFNTVDNDMSQEKIAWISKQNMQALIHTKNKRMPARMPARKETNACKYPRNIRARILTCSAAILA